MGCTEPIAVAYAGALARKALGRLPEKVTLTVSGNIIKNVKSVIVPHTGGRKGLRTAVAAGLLFGRADKELEALSDVLPEQLSGLDEYCEGLSLAIERSDARNPFDIRVRADSAYCGSQRPVLRSKTAGLRSLNGRNAVPTAEEK